MNVKTITCCFALLSMTTFAQRNEWLDPNVNAINRAPMHTNYFAYETTDGALKGVKESSTNFMSLNGPWKFFWVKNADARPTDFYRTDYNDKGWNTLNVPGLWELNGYGDPIYVNVGYPWRNQFKNNPPEVPVENNNVGSYRREIVVPADWKGKEIFAHFGSVTSNMYLWVNGQFVGYSEDSKLEAEFNLTKYLKPGKNLIAFQVFRWCDGTYLEDQDFFRYTGVGRDCYLYARNPKYIQDIRVTPTLDNAYKDAMLRVALNLSSKAGGTKVALELLDKNGTAVASTEVKGAGNVGTVMEIANPKKWSAEEPNLYTLLATLKDNGGNVIEVIPVKVGFRSVEIKNAQLLVNGQPVLIKGADRHEMDPETGYYVSPERMLQDIKLMKEFNLNAVRTCHYPDANLWYELCDEYGIYVVAEANIESHGMGYGEKTLAKNPAYAKAHLERNQRNVQRGWNHPSIITWSLGNEAGMGPNFDACYQWIKKEDPSRPVQYEQARMGESTDIFCPMYYGYEACEKYGKSDATKPLIQCEYAHAMGNSQGGFKEYWELVRKYPKYQGGFIWDFVDQSLRRTNAEGVEIYAYGGDFNRFDASDNNFLDNGLVSPDRVPNPHMYEVGYYYQSIWATPANLQQGEINVYNENFFRDLSGYYAEWQLVACGEVIETGIVSDLNVAPQKTAKVKLGYDASAIPAGKEVLLNVAFKLKKAETLLPAGHAAAKAQMVITPYVPAKLALENVADCANCAIESPVIKTNEQNYLVISNSKFTVEFSKYTGLMTKYEVGGLDMLEEGTSLTPNFWRAPTDNDYGAGLQIKYKAWRDPGMKLVSLNQEMVNGMAQVKAEYDLKAVSAKLYMTYLINNRGTVQVSEKLVADKSAKVSNMFRFGVQMQMPKSFSEIKYYGRGPIENYADRKTVADLGVYNQTVAEQFYPYIRPQETGTKSDIRWWRQMTKDGAGIEFISEAPFSASALNYTIESLDDGDRKDQRHSPEVPVADLTNVCIDKVQMGLACVNSWGAIPLPQYMIPYADYEFNFIMKPVTTKF